MVVTMEKRLVRAGLKRGVSSDPNDDVGVSLEVTMKYTRLLGVFFLSANHCVLSRQCVCSILCSIICTRSFISTGFF